MTGETIRERIEKATVAGGGRHAHLFIEWESGNLIPADEPPALTPALDRVIAAVETLSQHAVWEAADQLPMGAGYKGIALAMLRALRAEIEPAQPRHDPAPTGGGGETEGTPAGS